jgi:hypothetical protein
MGGKPRISIFGIFFALKCAYPELGDFPAPAHTCEKALRRPARKSGQESTPKNRGPASSKGHANWGRPGSSTAFADHFAPLAHNHCMDDLYPKPDFKAKKQRPPTPLSKNPHFYDPILPTLRT